MAIFEIQGPDGQIYEVDAPDEAAAVSAFGQTGAPAPVNAPEGYEHVGRFGDGNVFTAQDGSLTFAGPSFSTNDQDQIQQIMESGNLRDQSPGVAEGATRAALKGATFNFGDEIVAGGAAALDPLVNGSGGSFGERYDAYLGRERDDIDTFAKEHPKTALASEIGGAVFSAGGLAASGATLLKGGQTLAQSAKLGAVEGLGYGAVSGAGQAENSVTNRASGAFAGGAAGMALGGLAGPAIAGAKAMVSPVTDMLQTALGSASKRANGRVANAIQQSGKSIDDIHSELQQLGPEGFLVDTLGAPGESLARRTANIDPQARGILEGASRARTAGQPDRMTQKLLEASGLDRPQTIDELMAANRQSTQPAITKAYGEAVDAGFDIPNEPFRKLLQSPQVNSAVKRAERGVMDQVIANGQKSGSKLAVFDNAKKILDDRASAAYRAGRTNDGTTASALARRLRETVDANIPEYAGARGLAQNAARSRDAIELGAEGAKNNIPVDFGRRVEQVAQSDTQNVAQGYAADKISQIVNRRATSGVVNSTFGSPQQQSALQQALGQRAAPVQQQIASEQVFANTSRALEGNSSTARQLADMLGGNSVTGMLRQGAQKIRQGVVANKEAQVSPLVAEILKNREIPAAVVKKVEADPMLQNMLTRLLSAQGGEVGASLAVAP